MAGMDDYLRDTNYTGDSSEGGGQHMSLDDQGESFYGRVTGNQDKKFGDHDATKAARQKGAAKGLMGGEKSALGGNGSKITGDGMDGARQGEGNVASGTASENATSGFKNKVAGITGKGGKGKAKGGFKGKMKKAMPMIFAACGIGGFGACSFFGQMAMPFSLLSQLQNNFDSMGPSNYVRTKKLMKIAMRSSDRNLSDHTEDFIKKHSKIYQKFNPDVGEKYFHVPKKAQRRLSKKGIEVKTDGSGNQVLKYKTPSGEELTITPDNIQKMYEQNPDFRIAYHEGTRTWRQAINDWFDNLCLKLIRRLQLNRNRFGNFDANKNQEEAKIEYEKTVKDAEGDGATNGGTDDQNKHINDDADSDNDGKLDSDNNGSHSTNSSEKLIINKGSKWDGYAATAQKVETFARNIGSKYNKAKARIQQALKIPCILAEMSNAVSLVIIATEMKSILDIGSTIFSGVNQSQVTDSENSPIHSIANSLTEKKTTTYYNSETEKETKYGSAMEANALTSLYGNKATDLNDRSVKSFNLSDGIDRAFKAMPSGWFGTSSSVEFYKNCLISKIASAAMDILGDIISVVEWGAAIFGCVAGILGTGGATCGPLIRKLFKEIATRVAIASAIETCAKLVSKYLVPGIASMFARDLAVNIGGEDFGNALISAGNMYQGKNHQAGGGAAASKEYLVTHLKAKEEYIADLSRYERETKSPFDATSPYTFMGKLLSSSIPILVGSNSILGGINNVVSTTTKAFSSLMPGASAVSAAVTAQEAADASSKNCPELDSIGAVGDPFCNPYRVADYSAEVMEADPADIVMKVNEFSEHNFTDDEGDVPTINTEIKNDNTTSRLMEYIAFCGERDSPLGVIDMGIGGAITEQHSTWEYMIPIWGGIIDIAQNEAVLKKLGYVTGESCVAKNGELSVRGEAVNWDEAKYYQRFIEDQRYLEAVGLVEENAVSIALDKYHEDHPLDESYEGVIARLSGRTKEDVIAVFDLLEVLAWEEGYDPNSFYPYGYEKPEEEQIEIEDDELIKLEDYNMVDDYSWKYMFRTEYAIS